MKGFKKLLILFLISALILGVGAVSAADDLGAADEIINTEVSADLNAIDDSQSIDDSNSDDIISVNEENENEEIQSGESASLGEDNDILKESGNTITVEGNTFEDIQTAINSASEGDTIVLSGTYYGDGEPIYIYSHNLTIKGNQQTVLDAYGLSSIIDMKFYDDYSSIFLENLNFVNANSFYGAISLHVSNIEIKNCNFTDNHGDYSIMYVNGEGNCKIENCLFEQNSAYDEDSDGQILFVSDTINTVLINSSFKNNRAYALTWMLPGGSITNCVFMDNAGFFWPLDYMDCLDSVYMDNGIYDFSMKVYDDIVLGNPLHYYEDYDYEESPNWLIYLEHYGSKEGTLVVSLDGEEVYNEEMNHINRISLSDFQGTKYGSVDMAVKFVSDGTEVLLYEGTVDIDYYFEISGFYDEDSLIYYSSDSFTIYLPEDATGELTLYDGIKTYVLSYATGESTFKLNASNYKIGNHTLSVSLTNDPIYPDKTITRIFYVIPEIYTPLNVAIGENEFITIEVPEDFDGTIIIYNGTEEEVEVDYGDWTDYEYIVNKDQEIARITDAQGLIKIPISSLPLKIGENHLIFGISGEGYYEKTDLLRVFENDDRFSSSIDSTNIKLGDNLIVRVTAPRINGALEIYVVNENIYKEFSLTKTSFAEIISGLGLGEHVIKVVAGEYVHGVEEEDFNFLYSNTFYVNVTEEGQTTPELDATIELDYLDDNLIITLKDVEGTPLDGKLVSVFVNGNQNNLTTNQSGIATLQITENSTVKAVYTDANGLNVSSNLIIRVIEKTVTEELPVSANATISLTASDTVVKIVLNDLSGNALANAAVNVSINGGEFEELSTDENGILNIALSGNYTIKVVYTDNNGASVSASLVNKVINNTVIEYITPEGSASANATISFTPTGDTVKIVLKDLNGNPLNKLLNVTINGVSYNMPTGLDGTDGETSVTVKGNYTIVAIYTDELGASVSASLVNVLTPVVPPKITTSISASAITTVAKTNKNLVLTLRDANGAILSNKQVTVSVNGNTITVNTNANGQATIKTNFAASGTYYYSLCYLGDDSHKASFTTVKVTVNKQATKAVFKAKTFKVKATKKISFTLKDASGKVIAKKKITFKVNGKTYTATTNSKGVATVTIKITKKGKYTATAKFAGDSAYKAISKKATITIK